MSEDTEFLRENLSDRQWLAVVYAAGGNKALMPKLGEPNDGHFLSVVCSSEQMERIATYYQGSRIYIPSYMSEIKGAIIQRVRNMLDSGSTLADVSREFGVSSQTVARWARSAQ